MVPLNQGNDSLIAFQGRTIRRIWSNGRWFFSVIDIIAVLSGSDDPRNYWKVLKFRLKEEGGVETVTRCNQLKMMAPDGKMRLTDCADTETVLRLIQSIPSKNAEPFKRWLAKVGYERIQEIVDPELAQHRMKELYRQKGYSDEWIEKRVRGIIIRDELTDEWKGRGVDKDIEFAILTADISKATFGLTPSEYKKLKGLKRENLRDHMNDLELIFTMLGERVTTEITRKKDKKGFPECEDAAIEGGEVAGIARKEAESRIGESIISKKNFIDQKERKKRIG